jgi:two-component system, NtrC family, sensor histidine kinase PilS
LRARLSKVIAARLVVSTLLLGAAIAIELANPDSFPVNPFVFLIGLTYALSVVYLATLRWAEKAPAIADVHFALDAVLVSAFIHVTGGITSHFSSLYVLPIIAASTVRSKHGAMQVASLSATLYSGLVFAQYLDVGVVPSGWWLPVSAALPTPGFAQYTVAINLSGMFAVALLSGSLAERLRSARAGLADASDEMADLRAFNDHLIDSLISGLVTTDEHGRIVTFNRAAMRLTGLSPDDVRGRDVHDILQLPPGAATSNDSKGRRLEVLYKTAGGQSIEIGLTVSPLLFPEGTIGHLVTFQDITDLKRFERETRMQQRLAAVGEMAAGIAHEVRNPLAAMSGSLELLRRELPLSNDQAELMDIALRESERLNERIRLFLAYARPHPLNIARLDARRVVQDAAHLLRNSVDARSDHEIAVDVPGEPVWIDGDETEIRQIVWSLGTNGLRSMVSGGQLRLSARLDQADADAALVLVVQDHGCGIPAAELDDVFQPFKRSFAKGAGLGLAIVHRIVTDHGGHVQVSSTVDVGTTVTVRLPSACAGAPSSESPSTRDGSPDSLRTGRVPNPESLSTREGSPHSLRTGRTARSA